ncbi:MAG: hypothetical protein NT026_01440 [Candidatus Staskawiczbacteria bacterium]|nr:hypothetical protein [Candidatus Staskawiczbacteria bacterium]
MIDQGNKDMQENIGVPEKRKPAPEEGKRFDWEKEKREGRTEKKEISPDDKIVSEELKRELDLMDADESAKADVEKSKEKIEYLGEKEKIEHLLQMAREKGLVFAISVARKMNEPYLLDVLHDILAKEGFYNDFIKK